MELSNQFGIVAILFVICWFAAQLAIGMFVKVLELLPVANQQRLLWFLVTLPVTLPVMILLALGLVAWAKNQGLLDQHCLGYQGILFCSHEMIHQDAVFSPFWLGAAGLFLIAFTLLHAISKFVHTHLKTKTLLKLTQGRVSKRLVKLSQSQAYAFVLGVRQPTIVWSEQLSKCLSKHQQRIVLAHEIAHIRRQDVLKNFVFELWLAFHIRPQTLRRYWQFNMETGVDDTLSCRFEPFAIAEVLLKLSRANLKPQAGLAFSGSATQKRIERLIYPCNTKHYPGLEWLAWLLVVFALLFTSIEHHSVEWLIAWVWL